MKIPLPIEVEGFFALYQEITSGWGLGAIEGRGRTGAYRFIAHLDSFSPIRSSWEENRRRIVMSGPALLSLSKAEEAWEQVELQLETDLREADNCVSAEIDFQSDVVSEASDVARWILDLFESGSDINDDAIWGVIKESAQKLHCGLWEFRREVEKELPPRCLFLLQQAA